MTKNFLQEIDFEIGKIDQDKKNTKQLTILRKKVAYLTKVVNQLIEGSRVHDKEQKEYTQDILELLKKESINISSKRKNITTVPWQTGSELYKQRQEAVSKLKKQKKKQ